MKFSSFYVSRSSSHSCLYRAQDLTKVLSAVSWDLQNILVAEIRLLVSFGVPSTSYYWEVRNGFKMSQGKTLGFIYFELIPCVLLPPQQPPVSILTNAGLFHRLSLALPVGLEFVQSVFESTVFELSCRLQGVQSIENTGGRDLEPALCSEPLQSFSILQAKFKGIRNYSPSWAFSFVRRSNSKRQTWEESSGQSCLLLLEGRALQGRADLSSSLFLSPALVVLTLDTF